MENQNDLGEIPHFTPTREQIAQCGKYPATLTRNELKVKARLDEQIVDEADRRFGSTMALVDPGQYLVGEPPKIPKPAGYMQYDYDKL
jgi:hypothetical protein